jgi:hypothetical protein
MSISDELPLAIIIVDADEKIRAFMPQLEGVVDHGMISLEEVTAISYGRPGR